jgi:hypothetical protein
MPVNRRLELRQRRADRGAIARHDRVHEARIPMHRLADLEPPFGHADPADVVEVDPRARDVVEDAADPVAAFEGRAHRREDAREPGAPRTLHPVNGLQDGHQFLCRRALSLPADAPHRDEASISLVSGGTRRASRVRATSD